jgi:hypothetical protein
MSRMNRYLRAAAVSLFALWPLAVSAASPSPSPALDQVLAAPPSGFSEVTSASMHGEFTAHQYASNADASKQASVENTLNHDGFVAGYGKTWVSNVAQHVLVEEAMAFTGGKGARDWLNAAEVGDKANTTYQHADSMSGIDPYYGEHIFDSASKLYGDGFAFAKGNDVFVVAVVSTKDDTLTQATAQTRVQYSSAPDQTIPTSQWPENNQAVDTSSSAYQIGVVVGRILIFALVAGVVVFVFALVRRNRQKAAAGAAAAYAGGPAAYPGDAAAYTAAVPYAGAPNAAATPDPGPVQMSPDGGWWWDGQAWRDAAHEVPPTAQRSPDGGFWWDGRAWRPVPQMQAPPAG